MIHVMDHLQSAQPIGIFDSGIGGLTVAKAILQRLPQEQLLYFGDTAHLPYGDKSPDAILHYSETITRYLMDKGAKMIVIACNTASSVAYEHLQFKYGDQVMIVNVIDPVVKATLADPMVRNIGIIGTKGTIQSNAYERRITTMRDKVQVHSLATPLLVPMIEEGYFDNQISHTIIEAYLNYPDFSNIDALILGCTHYPLIRPAIEAHLRGRAVVMDSTTVVADAVARQLSRFGLLAEKPAGPHHFMVSDYTRSFEQTARLFFGDDITLEHTPIWD